VKIYLLRLDPNHAFFYAESAPEPTGAEAGAQRRGLAAWLDRRWRIWRQRLVEAESRTGHLLRSIEHRLLRFVAADEAMLRAFRTAKPELLIHPQKISKDSARQFWRHYLAREQRRHLFWLAINLVLLPPAVLLAVLPGPNVFGFWFAFRVAGHGLALAGIRQARRAIGGLLLEPCAVLDRPLKDPEGADAEQLRHVANTCGLGQLRSYLERLGREGGHAGTVATGAVDRDDP
jgi:hypothetical protein